MLLLNVLGLAVSVNQRLLDMLFPSSVLLCVKEVDISY